MCVCVCVYTGVCVCVCVFVCVYQAGINTGDERWSPRFKKLSHLIVITFSAAQLVNEADEIFHLFASTLYSFSVLSFVF